MDFILILIVLGAVSIFYLIIGAVKSRLYGQLHDAVASDRLDKVRQMIKDGKDVKALSPRHDIYGGWTPLHQAKSARVAELLISSGADVNALSDHGWTPLYLKCKGYKGRQTEWDVIEVLIDNGAKRGLSHDKDDPKLIESTLGKAGRADLMVKVIENESEGLNRSPLHIAAGLGDARKIKALIDQGEDINTCDKEGLTPLLMALLENRLDVVDLLLEHNIDVNIPDKDGTLPISVAAGLGKAAIVSKLIAKGSKINHQEKDGCSPLHYACHQGHEEIIKMLLAHGADANAEDHNGLTPLEYAGNHYIMIKGLFKES